MSFSRRSRRMALKLILCGVPLLLFQLPVLAAQSVVLAWQPSPSTNVVGYDIYYGTACRDYDSEITVGNTNSATVTGLADGTTYYFAATAVDSSGVESPFSNEAVYNVPSPPPRWQRCRDQPASSTSVFRGFSAINTSSKPRPTWSTGFLCRPTRRRSLSRTRTPANCRNVSTGHFTFHRDFGDARPIWSI